MAALLRFRYFPRRAFASPRNISTTSSRSSADTPGWEGRRPNEHVTNSENELDVQSSASESGKRQRVEESHPTSAATEKDTRNDNEQAKQDHPEAPGPVIGMNSERGGVSAKLQVPNF